MKLAFEGKSYTRLDTLLKDVEGDLLNGELVVNDQWARPIVFIDGTAQLKPGVDIAELVKGLDRGLQ